MGQRGPLPDHEKIAEFPSPPSTGQEEAKSPEKKAKRIVCPHWLSETARSKWKALAPELIANGRLTYDDAAMFAVWCQTYATWVKAQKVLKEKGLSYDHPNGIPVKRPEVDIAASAARDLKALGAHFGLTPAGRAALPADLPDAEGDLEGLD